VSVFIWFHVFRSRRLRTPASRTRFWDRLENVRLDPEIGVQRYPGRLFGFMPEWRSRSGRIAALESQSIDDSGAWFAFAGEVKKQSGGIMILSVTKRSKYRYFSEHEWAERFMDGSLLFRSLSHFKKIEDGEVRGDSREGSILFKPEGGLVVHNKTQGKSFTIPEGAFGSGINTEEVFVLCCSNSMTEELRIRFEAKACVQIMRIHTFCARIQYELTSTATFRAEKVVYYSPSDEPGAKWALPDMIAFSKVDGYAWQDEYRFCISLTDALKYGKTSQQVRIPNQPSGTALPPPPPLPREYPMTVKALGDICKIFKY
jgi:hypothetical protein